MVNTLAMGPPLSPRETRRSLGRRSNQSSGSIKSLASPPVIVPVEGEEEPNVTRCVCGSTDDQLQEGEFILQCETCDVWQHGLCVGYENEAQVADINYYCEQCRPDLHQELLRSLAKRARQSSATSHGNNNPSSTSRISRSHSEAASHDHPGPPPRAGVNAELADEDGAAGKRKRTEDDM
ncbi:hypothetical protein FIBSPDRAFT_116534 [Athelia psychrophila]|uniref:PHD-type domain-containing protein n=1 Tax=Athelia psychrophila TaxID=1759441 RepID=A0A166D098_9AGAM|nr:hypothetical protein FIBSPDRAFT_116534 [Fibularhizoctonia sp. CBS 109695]